MTTILVGTDSGLHTIEADGARGSVHHAGRRVVALGAEYPDVWAVVDGSEVWRSDGNDWILRGKLDGFDANCIADTRAGYLVGTSEAHLFRVADSGLEIVDAFERVKGRADWYTPWGGPADVRSISEDRDVVLVNVHVGGIVRTLDEGATWEPTIDIDADVHRVLSRDGRIYAACAVGLAVSDDRGDSWDFRTEGLHADYCRAVALAGDTVLVSASTGPGGKRSAVYRGARTGGPLERCTDWFDKNVDSAWLDSIADQGIAAFGTADGSVFMSTDEGANWTEIASGLRGVQCLLLMP